MLNKQQSIFMLLYFFIQLFEIISLYLLMSLITNDLNPFHLLTIYIIPLVAVRWIEMKSKQLPYIMYSLIPIAQLTVLFSFGYSFTIIAAVVLFSFWRIYAHIKDRYIESQGVWLSIVLSATFAILVFKRDFLQLYVSWFLLLLLLFFAIRILIQLKENSWHFMKNSYRMLAVYIIAIFLAVITMYHGGLFVIRAAFPFAIQQIANLFGYPLAWMIDTFKLDAETYNEITEGMRKSSNEKPVEELLPKSEISNGLFDQYVTYFLIGTVVVVFIIVFYYTRKHLKNITATQEESILLGTEVITKFSIFDRLKKLPSTFYSDASKNEIRIQFNKLQLFFKKQGRERLPFETAEEWFERIGLNDEYSKQVLNIYEKSRYSDVSFTKTEIDTFIKGIKLIKTL